MLHPLCHELQRRVKENLPGIQQQFSAYQEECFIERTPEFFCLELCGETGELANLEKKRWRGTIINESDVCDEAADVFIALMNFCNARGVNLAESVEKKLSRIQPNK